jgi:iron(III) transport system permease protein
VQSTLRALFGWRSAADYWFPNIRSLGGAVLIMGLALYPYVYLAARAMFQTQSTALIESARSLGAAPWRLACDIALPMARPAIAAGVALALLEALNDVGASEYLGVQTLTLSIFTTWLNRSSLPGAAQIACLLLFAIALLIALERRGRRRRRFVGLDTRPGERQRFALPKGRGWIALAACLVPILLGFFVPLAHLTYEVIIRSLRTGFELSLVRHAVTTISLASCATRWSSSWASARPSRCGSSAARSPACASSSPASAMRCRARCWRWVCWRRWSASTKPSTPSRAAWPARSSASSSPDRAPRSSAPM